MFLNCSSGDVAARFVHAIHHHPLGRKDQDKCEKVTCSPAPIQGLQENLKRHMKGIHQFFLVLHGRVLVYGSY